MSISKVTKDDAGLINTDVYNQESRITLTEKEFSLTDHENIDIMDETTGRISYRTTDNPPVHLALFFALQNIFIALPWCLSTAILVADFVCAENDYNLKAILLSTTLLMSGLTTIVQVTIGIRLPVYQGPTAAYIIPLLALKELPEWTCPLKDVKDINVTTSNFSLHNISAYKSDIDFRNSVILPRLQMTMGCLALSGFIHMCTGMFGFVGFVMKFVGPITIIPTVLLIGIGSVNVTVQFCQVHWGIAALTGITSLILSVYLDGWKMPIPIWTCTKRWHIIRYPFPQEFSILISTILGWGVSAIFTVTEILPNNPDSPQYMARTDVKTDVIRNTPWFYIPYPGQFGSIDFSGGLFMGFLTATLYSITDSIADYHACAKITRVPPPPVNAINRGILVEGCLTMISGLFGAGHGTSTYGIHIGTIGLTKVASRFVYILFSCLLITFAIIGKLAAMCVTIPYPVLGGAQIMGFGMFIGLVMSNLQYIDMNSTRNLAIMGVSTLLGLMLPFWAAKNSASIDTGSEGLDSFISVVLSNPSLVGGFTSCFLDNTVPGNLHERGMLTWGTVAEEKTVSGINYDEGYEIYEIQSWSAKVNKLKFTKYIPIFPNYNISKSCTFCAKKS